MSKQPRPRNASYYGMRTTAHINSDGTWIEPEELTYPSGGFKRRAYAVICRNEHNPVELPYGAKRVVTASIPDTFISIPARLKYRGKTINGYLSTAHDANPEDSLQFRPEASPDQCPNCKQGEGCRKT